MREEKVFKRDVPGEKKLGRPMFQKKPMSSWVMQADYQQSVLRMRKTQNPSS
jgi:hypothetical protein